MGIRHSSLMDREIGEWLHTGFGTAFLAAEDKVVTQHIANLFGYHLLMMGAPAFSACLHATKISHQVHVHPEFANTDLSLVKSRADKLPIATESVDVAYLPHVLEFTHNPHEVLREIYRVLYPEGHLLLTGLNSLGLLGAWKLAHLFSKHPPWCGHFYPTYKIKDWLNLLGFDIFAVQHFFFRLPVNSEKWLKRFEFCDKLGTKLSLPVGSGFLILACKRLGGMTPLVTRWPLKEKIVASGDIAEPTTRGKW